MSFLAAAGAALGIGSQIYGGYQAKKASKEQARLIEEQARRERLAAEFEAQQQERNFERLLGQQRLNFAASGVKLEGSALDIIEETVKDKEQTIKNILEAGATRSARLRSEAALTRRRGRDVFISSLIGAGGQALRSGSQIAGASKTGNFSSIFSRGA